VYSLYPDITIIGAGPIGSLAAIHSDCKNHEVVILEQRKKIGFPDHCAGLISKNGLELLGLKTIPSEIIQNDKIKGAKFFSPSGLNFIVKRKNSQAMVVNRELFDRFLADEAEKKGAKILLENKVTRISSNNKDRITLQYKDKMKNQIKNIDSFVGIIAEGGRGKIAQQAGFKKIPTKSLLPSYQVLVENITDLDTEFVEMYTSNQIAPGFFAWIIPISDTSAKVGLASNNKLSVARLDQFINKHLPVKGRFNKSKIVKKFGGEVIIRGLRKRTSAHGLMIAGDVAGQTKATTGGGIITGGLAGVFTGEIAASAVKNNDNSYHFLKQYDNLWKNKLYSQFRIMSLFRWCINRLNDKALDEAFSTVIDNDLMELIEEKADIDSQAEILLSLLKHPAVFKLIFKIIPNLQF